MKAICLSEPDAERLGVLHRFVRTPVEGSLLKNLEERIADADVVPPAEVPRDLVTMNSRVRVTDLNTGQAAVYTLAFPSGANARKRFVSVLGSLGAALLGHRVGEVVNYTSSAGPESCRIEELLYQPEAAGDLYA